MSDAERLGARTPELECYRLDASLRPVDEEELKQPGRGLAVIWVAEEDAPLPAGVMPPSPPRSSSSGRNAVFFLFSYLKMIFIYDIII